MKYKIYLCDIFILHIIHFILYFVYIIYEKDYNKYKWLYKMIKYINIFHLIYHNILIFKY